ncbi:MAG: phosphoribosylformylglycinamidine cyclo-ligase [Actinobacteria bacterium]|nr:phosphoribosylformylglycinamidine cyclo-ligase [Actinomycetota bacterium]
MSAYREAGVDLDAAERAVALIRALAGDATRPEVVEGVGGFAGLFRIGDGRLLAAATDGVGTKVEVARLAGRLDTVGIDLVAMCADDVACTGAEPLLFLDYLAVGRVEPEDVAAIVSGVAEGCRRAGCALLGGETAEHPGVLDPGRFDLAGFCVGVVAEDEVLGPDRVREGDVVVGLSSSGLHSNGFSLVRRVLLEEAGLSLDAAPPGLPRPLGDELLEPTAIYAPLVRRLAGEGLLHAAAHVTGGGLPGNLPRVLPPGLRADVDRGSWPVPPIFGLVAEAGDVDPDEMAATFNMGIGMALVIPPENQVDVLGHAEAAGSPGHVIGRIVGAG